MMKNTEKFTLLHSSLMSIAHNSSFIGRNKNYKIQSVIRSCAQQLAVSRVSVWRFSDNANALICEQLYNHKNNHFEQGLMLKKNDYPHYFAALNENRIIAASHAHTDTRTAEFTEDYLKPLSIMSLLDAPIFLQGKIYGALCIEHCDQIKQWDVAELSYAASIADTISLINEHETWLSAREEMASMRKTDQLTGLLNRRYLQEFIDRDLANPVDDQQQRSLILMGVDGFTDINDDRGHHVADNVLAYLGRQFESLSQHAPLIAARIGGDTFGFWLNHCKNDTLLDQYIAKIKAIYTTAIPVATGNPISLTATLGVITRSHSHLHIEEPILYAEEALKRAKEEGRGSIVFFSDEWINETQIRRELEKEIQQAFTNKQLRAYYQPLVCAKTGLTLGIEALVRWDHPIKGMIPPYKFLTTMTEMGLMRRLGEFMLMQACSDMQKLRQLGIDMQWVSVNLSSEQLYDPSTADNIKQLLQRFDLPCSALELEVVEELISQESDTVKTQLAAIDELGVRLAIDDFGTGYSSLSRLKHLPVSKLKIDKSFVDGLPDTEEDKCIANSIIGLAKGIKVDLVAEGVETQNQADWLTQQGVDYIQGYLYAKPMSFEDLALFCRSQ